MENKRIDHVLEDVATELTRAVVLLEAAREAREREEEEGETVIDKIEAVTAQLTLTAGELATDVGTVTTRLEDDLKRIAKDAHLGPSENDENTEVPRPTPSAAPMASYAAAAARPSRPDQVAALAKAVARKRQILIEGAAQTEQWLVGLSDKEIVEKARMAAVLMAQTGVPSPPPGATFVGAERQRSGSVLLHMNTSAAATWLKTNIDAFLEAMGGTTAYKERLANIIVQYIPVSFDPELDGALRTIEDDNNLPRGTLASARWIKPAQRRNAGQKVAHAIFGFSDDAAANVFIREGAYVEGRKVYGRKQLTEPIRCMKCQGVGLNHVAATCKSICDVCARCGGVHRTTDCVATDDQRACANCKIAKRPHEGHGAADRSCPVFQDKLQFALERNPEAKYPYFLVEEDPGTWVTHDERAQALPARSAPEWRRAEQTRKTGKQGVGPDSRRAATERAQMTQPNGPDWTRSTGPRQRTLVEMAGKAAGVYMHPDRAERMAGVDPEVEKDPAYVTAREKYKALANKTLANWQQYEDHSSWDDDVRITQGDAPAARRSTAAGPSGSLPPVLEEEGDDGLPAALASRNTQSPETVAGANA
jgi:hypothetical protein